MLTAGSLPEDTGELIFERVDNRGSVRGLFDEDGVGIGIVPIEIGHLAHRFRKTRCPVFSAVLARRRAATKQN